MKLLRMILKEMWLWKHTLVWQPNHCHAHLSTRHLFVKWVSVQPHLQENKRQHSDVCLARIFFTFHLTNVFPHVHLRHISYSSLKCSYSIHIISIQCQTCVFFANPTFKSFCNSLILNNMLPYNMKSKVSSFVEFWLSPPFRKPFYQVNVFFPKGRR